MDNMNLPIFKPQKFQKDGQFTGAAISFQLGRTNKGPALFLNAVKQKDWNEEKRLGSFYNNKDEGQSACVKFNEIEIGGLIYAIRAYKEFSAFHTFDSDKTQISFSPYKKKDGKDAFSLTVTRNGLKIGLGVELAEAEAIRVFLETALAEIFYATGQQQKSE
jgi:hypothetical protein